MQPGIALAPPVALDAVEARDRRLRSDSKAAVWMGALVASICFEGLGRKFLPFIPAMVFYFLKDVVLLAGLAAFGIHPRVVRIVGVYYRPFQIFFGLAVVWTVLEVFNPDQNSFVLGLVGLRSYWLWFMALLIIPSAVRTQRDRQAVVAALAAVALVVGAFAAYQFRQPADAAVNSYALYQGQQIADIAVVDSTQRVRVSSTFGYLSGFFDFTIIAPSLLLSFGITARGRARILCLTAAVVTIVTMPMAGSRTPVVINAFALMLVIWQGGYLRSALGRRTLLTAVLLIAGGSALVPDAAQGVIDRFNGEDTGRRASKAETVFAPIAMTRIDYPSLGIGTGMQQNARFPLGVTQSTWNEEEEPGRYLIELGAPGYLAIWLARIGLVVMLIRIGRLAKRLKQNAIAGAAYAFAPMTFLGTLTFDHVYQALYCVGVGLIIASVVWAEAEAAPVPQRPAPPPHLRRVASRR